MANKKEKDLAAAMAMFASLATETGIELDTTSVKPIDSLIEAEVREESLREADAVLVSLTYPQALMTKLCKGCGLPFQTGYRGVGCCSTICRRTWFRREVGIDYNFSRGSVWGEYEPPLVISAERFKYLETWAAKFLEDAEWIRSQLPDQSPETPLDSQESDFEWEDTPEPEEDSTAELTPETPPAAPRSTPTQVPASLPSPLDILDDLDFEF